MHNHPQFSYYRLHIKYTISFLIKIVHKNSWICRLLLKYTNIFGYGYFPFQTIVYRMKIYIIRTTKRLFHPFALRP